MSSVTDHSSSDYFYPENYYDYAVQSRSLHNSTAISITHLHGNSLIRLILTILLRAGFVLVQLGSVPVNNVNLILLQNVADFGSVTVMYFLTGFLVAYNGDLAGLIGEGRWIGDPMADKNEAIAGWQAVVIASAICTTAVAGRMHTAGYLVVGALLSGLIQPLLIHWAWTAEGWMAENELAGRIVSFKDYAGSAVVHVVGGLVGLIGCIMLGRRMLRLKDLDDASITAGSAGTVFGGLLLVFVGLQGLCMNNERDKLRLSTRDPSHAYVNNLLAASSCTLSVVGLHFALSRETFNHWTVMRCVQGMLAGVVTVSAAANDYSPQIAIALGCLGGVAFYLISRQVFRSALEDYCNVVAVHLGCAILGSLLAPFCVAVHLDAQDTATLLLNFSWQLICLAALFALVGTAMLLVFGVLQLCGILRNRSEWLNHARANVAVDKGPPRSFLRRLFSPDKDSLYLQPGSISSTEHGPSARFSKYQTEIDNFERGRSIRKPEMNVKTEANVQPLSLGTRIKKTRQVHTLSGSTPVLIEDQGGTGESINHELLQVERKQFFAREMKRALDPIEEIDEEYAKEYENVQDCNAGDQNSILLKSINAFAATRDSNESNYQLRRTAKLVNLHQEFSKEDLRVVLGPKRVDSSSSDSCDEDIIFAKTSDMNESTKDLATSKTH